MWTMTMAPSTTDIYLSLGSNLGERERQLKEAIRLLEEALEVPVAAVSSFLENAPQGFESDKPFLNCCVRFAVSDSVTPLQLLKICKEIERRLGRENEGKVFDESGARVYRDRPIDIDILYFGDERVDSPELTIPHPGIPQRDFVKIPLREIMK